MKSKYSKSLFVVALVAALISPAWATGHKPPPKTDPPAATSTSSSAAAATAGAKSASLSGAVSGSFSGGGEGGNATGGRSDATGGRSNATGGTSDATAQGGAAAARQGQVARGGSGGEGGAGGAGGTGNGSVDVGGDISDYESKALALALPGLVAAPAVPGECRIHTRGWGALSAGATGGTKLEMECMKRQHCLNLADRFAAWGFLQAAARQLAACDGVTLTAGEIPIRFSDVPTSNNVDLSQYPTRDEVIERDNRVFEKSLGK